MYCKTALKKVFSAGRRFHTSFHSSAGARLARQLRRRLPAPQAKKIFASMRTTRFPSIFMRHEHAPASLKTGRLAAARTTQHTRTHAPRERPQVRGKVKLREKATLEFHVGDARPPAPAAQGHEHTRALKVYHMHSKRRGPPQLSSWRAAEDAARACEAHLQRPSKRSRRR